MRRFQSSRRSHRNIFSKSKNSKCQIPASSKDEKTIGGKQITSNLKFKMATTGVGEGRRGWAQLTAAVNRLTMPRVCERLKLTANERGAKERNGGGDEEKDE